MKILRVAIIDDGIDRYSVSKEQLFESFIAKGDILPQEVVDSDSHATHCYKVFSELVRVPYHLISIKVLSADKGIGSIDSLVSALHWCQTQDIDLMNMSMGTCQFLDFLAVEKAIASLEKTIVVAACSNENTITLPACLSNVIGVRHCNIKSLKGKFIYVTNSYDQIEVMTYAENNSNSMVAPMVTAQICNYFNDGYVSLKDIRHKLMKDSVKDKSFLSYEFYKNLLLEWEEIQVPIVLVSSNQEISKLKPLILEFIKEGYRAIALTSKRQTGMDEYILSLVWEIERVTLTNLIKLYYNFTMPDILFLHLGAKELCEITMELDVDIVLKPSWLSLDTEELYMKIKEMLE